MYVEEKDADNVRFHQAANAFVFFLERGLFLLEFGDVGNRPDDSYWVARAIVQNIAMIDYRGVFTVGPT